MPNLDDLDSFDLIVLRDYLGDHWSEFEDWCEKHDADPEKIYQALGGE